MEKIVEGEFMSVDPIVGGSLLVEDLLTGAGFDIMDSHLADDVVVWHHLSSWDGSGCLYLFAIAGLY